MIRAFRQHWGVLFLSVVALSFIAVQVFLATRRDTEVTEIYFADRLTEAHHILIDEYNRLHEGKVRVVPIDFPNADYTTNERKEILAKSLRSGGEGLDLFAVDVIWVQRFERWCEPLDPYFTRDELRGFSDDGLRSCYKDGQLVAIPFGLVRGVLLYREDLLRTIPGGDRIIDEVNRGITWDRFIAFGRTVPPTHAFYVFPAAEYEGLICCFTEVLLGRERDYFCTHGFNFVTPAAREALQLMVDLVQKYKVTPEVVTSMTEVSSYEYFMNSGGLFIRGWTTYGKDFPEGSTTRHALNMAPLPHLADGLPTSTTGGWNLMVSKFSTKKKEAVDFAKFLVGKEAQETMFTRGGFFPVIRSLYEDTTYAKRYPELSRINGMLSHGVHRPSHEKYTKYSDILARYVSMAIRGRIGVDDALTQATRAIESEKIMFEKQQHGTTASLP